MKVNYLTLLAGATLVLLSAAAARAEESAATALAGRQRGPGATKRRRPAPRSSPTMGRRRSRRRYRHLLPRLRSGAGFHCPRRRLGRAIDGLADPDRPVPECRGSPRPCSTSTGIGSNATAAWTSASKAATTIPTTPRLHYFGPKVEANIDYQRFDHQLYSDSYAGWATVSSAANTGVPANYPTL